MVGPQHCEENFVADTGQPSDRFAGVMLPNPTATSKQGAEVACREACGCLPVVNKAIHNGERAET